MIRADRLFPWFVGAVISTVCCGVSSAQEPNCDQTTAMARMARAKSSAALVAEKRGAGDSYRAEVVFTARSFELRPTEQRATVPLDIIPQDDGQHTTWITLGDSLCSAETIADMKSLARVGENLPRELARAVLLVPNKLPSYVAYAPTSVQDPHSDYAVQMQTVCRAKHPEFVKAVGGLPTDKKGLVRKARPQSRRVSCTRPSRSTVGDQRASYTQQTRGSSLKWYALPPFVSRRMGTRTQIPPVRLINTWY